MTVHQSGHVTDILACNLRKQTRSKMFFSITLPHNLWLCWAMQEKSEKEKAVTLRLERLRWSIPLSATFL